MAVINGLMSCLSLSFKSFFVSNPFLELTAAQITEYSKTISLPDGSTVSRLCASAASFYENAAFVQQHDGSDWRLLASVGRNPTFFDVRNLTPLRIRFMSTSSYVVTVNLFHPSSLF